MPKSSAEHGAVFHEKAHKKALMQALRGDGGVRKWGILIADITRFIAFPCHVWDFFKSDCTMICNAVGVFFY